MAVTISGLQRISDGNKWKVIGSATWTTYTTGGDAVTAAAINLSRIESFEMDSQGGYIMDPAIAAGGGTANLFVYRSAGFTPAGTVAAPVFTGAALGTHTHLHNLTIEESVAVAANAGTLAGVPGLVQNVFASAGGATGNKVILPNSQAIVAGQCRVNMATGVITFAAADAVTTALVTYINSGTAAVSAGTPAGTNSAPAFTGTAVAAALGVEVGMGVDLSGLGGVPFEATGL